MFTQEQLVEIGQMIRGATMGQGNGFVPHGGADIGIDHLPDAGSPTLDYVESNLGELEIRDRLAHVTELVNAKHARNLTIILENNMDQPLAVQAFGSHRDTRDNPATRFEV